MAGAALLPVAAAAQSATIEEMRLRDRLAAPADELATWQQFAAPLLAEPATPDALRGETLLGLAIAHYYAREHEQGWAELEQARALIEPSGQHSRAWRELLGYGSLLLTELERLDEAEQWAARAVETSAAAGEAALRDLALAHNARGYLAFARNDLATAEEAFCTARDLGLAAADANPAMVVNDASSCGAVKYYLERPDTLAAIRQARDYALSHLPDDHPRMGNVLNTSYAVMMQHGRYAEALPLIRRHLELERELRGDDDPYVYDALSMLGRALELLGRLEEAEAILNAASGLAGRIGAKATSYTAGISQTNLARVIARQGRIDEAVAVARSGVARLEADLSPDNHHIGSGRVQLADHLSRVGEPDEALALVESGLVLLEAGLPEGHSEILSARLVKARILSDLGRHEEAMALAAPAAESLASGLFDLSASQSELVHLSQALPLTLGDYLQVALAAGDMQAAVRVAQLRLTSELTLSNAQIRAGTLAREQGLGDVLDRLEEAQAREAEVEQAILAAQAGGGGVNMAEWTVDLADARAAIAAERAVLERDYPGYLAMARPDPASLATLQAALGKDELLVLPLTLRDRAVTLLVAREGVEWGETEMPGFAVEQLAARLHASARQAGHFDSAAAAELYDVLFPERLRPLLARKRHLLFPASGYLARLSPAMLLTAPAGETLDDAPWLLRSHAVEVLADLSELPSHRGSASNNGFLGVGAPSSLAAGIGGDGGLDLPLLPGAKGELESLASAMGTARRVILAEDQATEPNLAAQDLPGFGVIAFATHGLAGGEVPGLAEPALLLSPDPASGSDGLLTASEIAALSLGADWVILSACETSAGAAAGAPGYSGLARAFARAGARSLMLSHWRVRDDAASFLSVETVRRSASGTSRAEALRQAQLALMADKAIPDAAHPAIWAPFVMLEN